MPAATAPSGMRQAAPPQDVDGGHRHGGVERLVAALLGHQETIFTSAGEVAAGIARPFFSTARLPPPANTSVRGAPLAQGGGADDPRPHGARRAAADQGHAAPDDAGLFPGDGRQRGAQDVRMVQGNVGDDRDLGTHGGGGVQAPAQPHLQHRPVGPPRGEVEQRGQEEGLEKGRRVGDGLAGQEVGRRGRARRRRRRRDPPWRSAARRPGSVRARPAGAAR